MMPRRRASLHDFSFGQKEDSYSFEGSQRINSTENA
jgi:hypothetical protein